MCEVLGVSKSGYYYWKKELKDSVKTGELDTKIMAIFEDSNRTYGSPRIFKTLKRQGVEVSESTVYRRMKALEISPEVKKKFKTTTDSNHAEPIAANILDRKFEVAQPGRVWVSDITYIRVGDSFAYLTTVIDLADRMVVGWNVSDNIACPDACLGDRYRYSNSSI